MNEETAELQELASTNNAVQRLLQELESTDDDDRKIVLLNLLSEEIHRTIPELAINLAKQALGLAATHKDHGAEAESYRNIGRSNIFRSNFPAATMHLQRALRLFEKAGDELGRSRALANLGVVYYYNGDYRNALEVLHEAMDICERHEEPQTLNMVLTNLGAVYVILGNLPRALDYHFRSIRIKEELGIPIAVDLTNIARIQFEKGEYDEAENSLRRCLEMYREMDDRIAQIRALMNLGSVYGKTGRDDDSYRSNMEALELARVIGDGFTTTNVLISIAMLHRGRGEIDQAQQYIGEAEAISRELDSTMLWIEVAFGRGDNLRAVGELARAIEIFEEIVSTSRRIDSPDTERDAHERLAAMYEEQDNPAKALEHYKAFATIRDELIGAEQRNAIAQIELRAEIEASEREREILRLKSEQLELEMRHKNSELTSLAMQLVQKNEMLDELKEQIANLMKSGGGPQTNGAELSNILRQVESSRNSEAEWEIFEQQFRAIHHDFTDRLAREHTQLSPTELKVCALLKVGLSTKDIANMLCSSVRTVEDHRYRIRTKMSLPKETNLTTYLAAW